MPICAICGRPVSFCNLRRIQACFPGLALGNMDSNVALERSVDSSPTSVPSTNRWWLRLLVGRNPRRTLIRVCVLILAAFLIREYLFLPVRVVGISMEPTFRNGQVRLIARLAYRSSTPQRGDVVSIRLAGKRLLLLKRIIGLPGEQIEIRRGLVLVNGQPLEEHYLQLRRAPWDYTSERLQPDEYFVVGDNRSMDRDDHYFGKVKRERILGKVAL